MVMCLDKSKSTKNIKSWSFSVNPHLHVLKPDLQNAKIKEPYNDALYYYTCEEGYKLPTKGWWAEAKCNDSVLSELKPCIDKKCGDLPVIPNGEVTVTRRGKSAKVNCKEGYHTEVSQFSCDDGPLKIICTPIAIPCSPPRKVQNAVVVTPYQKEYLSDSEVTYKCRESYTAEGETTIQCRDGQWGETLITCTPCPMVPHIPNAHVVDETKKAEYQEGNVIHFACETGYISGPTIRYACTSEGWIALHAGRCYLKPCELPDDTPNGFYQIIHGEELVFGTKIKYFCNEGYQMVSKDDTRTCFLDNWTNHLPICDHGGLMVKGIPENDDPILPDRFLEFSCDGPWKYLNGSSMLICLKDGQWDNAFPTCEEKCKVTGVSNTVRFVTYRRGKELKFSCHKYGDTLLGNAEVTCSANGQWSAPFPTCGAPSGCGKPTPLENGDIEGTVRYGYRNADKVKYTCQNYYIMLGDPYKTCTNGEWIGQMRCLKPCTVNSHDLTTHNIDFRHSANNKLYSEHDDIIGFRCTSGRHDGVLNMRQKCNDGRNMLLSVILLLFQLWGNVEVSSSQNAPSGCGKPTPLADGDIEVLYQYRNGDMVKYICQNHYIMEGEPYKTCTNGEWIGQMRCLNGGLMVKGIPENDDPILPDRFLEFSCDGPWKYLNGSSMLICLKDGQWDNAFPTCEEMQVTGVSNTVRFVTYRRGKELKFSCHKYGDTLLGNAEVTCSANGQWSAPFPTCGAPSGGKPTPLENGDIEGTVRYGYRNADKVKYTCQNYYIMLGDPYKTCTNGEWIGQMRCLIDLTTHNIDFRHSANNKLYLEHDDIIGFRCTSGRHDGVLNMRQKCNDGAQWRMFSSMRAFQRLRYYTIVVQAQWRMRSAASAYRRIFWAATVIQKHSRAWALAKRDHEHYLHLRAAVMKIQRGYRRWKTQKMEKENCAAKVIQTVFRKWYEDQMAGKTAAAVRIQSWYRMQTCLHQYKKIKRSTELIQAQYRGHAQRRCFQMLKLQHHSAIVIQSAYRGHAVRKQVAEMRCAAVLIQSWFRASVERKMLLRMKCAAITIQAAYRAKVAREALKKQHKAATVIQTAFRKHATQRRYLVLKQAAAVIQQKYRATILARETKKDYDAFRNAALALQAHWRGRADRKRMEKRHQCATLIQAHYRRHKSQAEYRSKKACALVVQRHYRAYVAGKEMRKTYLSMRAACVTLQAAFRGMRVRKELRKNHKAATVIQSSVRMFICRKRYFLLQSAAIIIQSQYRALLLCKEKQKEYIALKLATLKIQAAYRGYKLREDLKKRHNAARAIQAQFRMHMMRMAYLATKCAAIIVQQRYRAKMLRDQQMQRYRTMKSAAVVIQAAYRGQRARRKIVEMHQAATIIQRKLLTIRDRNRFLALKAAVLVCQQRYRAVTLARKDWLSICQKRRAVICLQAAYRGCKVRKQLRIQHSAAITIQSHFRKYQQRTYYKTLCRAASVLQAHYRANKKMREEMKALRTMRNAAVVLQAAFRGMTSRRIIKQRYWLPRAYRAHCEHQQYQTLKSSILTIQRRYRANVAAKEQMEKYQRVRSAAVVIQAAHRGNQVRKEVARWHHAATVIQSSFRKHRKEVKFQAMRLSAIIIQRYYRSCILQRQDREKFLKVKHSVIVLQAAFRGHRVRSRLSKMHRAATVIQANFKRHKQQSALRKQRWAARLTAEV
ncbi:hypothetical protein F7725_028019 [Dissostichus mawsoni]|uniref:Sushi domain-containing protein n=1 Tax=Dissostichus mawsoni TaxID=36200 RepID=A0A7J5XEU3_DISMA|nr:hypothetical protein F7725_028019 [Dissostichus mawsoni]